MNQKEPITLICKHCGKAFQVPPHLRSRIFCSVECRNMHGPRSAVMISKTCPTCGRVFEIPQHQDQRIYCSRDCSNKRDPNPVISKVCPQCGKAFEYTYYGQDYTYCSHECFLKTIRREPKICPQCKREFDGKNSQKRKGVNQKYCSPECQGAARRTRIPKKCKACGKSFEVAPSRYERSHYCSRRCRLLHQYHSNAEQKVISLLANILGRTAKHQHTFSWLKNTTGRSMHIDGFFPDFNLAIEYDGRQHFEFVPYYHVTEEQFHELQQRDALKASLLESHGIHLLRVSYREPKTESHLRKRLLELLPPKLIASL